MAWFAFLIALLAGGANPVQSAAHGQLNKQLGQPVWAGVAVYAIGFVGMLIVQDFVREHVTLVQVGHVSSWAWTGGLVSIASTLAALILVQKLGSGIFTSVSVTASLVVSLLLDQFGWMGLKQHPVSAGRLIGMALLVGGVWLVGKS